jgi:hypothetical protein
MGGPHPGMMMPSMGG